MLAGWACNSVARTSCDNVAMWTAIHRKVEHIIVYSCGAANTERRNQGTRADGRYLMGALAIHTNANVYAADRIQWYHNRKAVAAPYDSGLNARTDATMRRPTATFQALVAESVPDDHGSSSVPTCPKYLCPFMAKTTSQHPLVSPVTMTSS
jgi:hypothetical protein